MEVILYKKVNERSVTCNVGRLIRERWNPESPAIDELKGLSQS